MKRIFTLISVVLIMSTTWAQSPEKMSYQAVIRNSNNQLVTNTQIGMQISILQGSASGTPVYVETHTPTTNANGLVSIEIGTGTTSNDFSIIDWANGPYFVKTETDPQGGTSYSIAGISQLLSVPYALHAKMAENVTGTITESQISDLGNYLTSYTEADPEFTSWDKSTGISITESQITDLDHFTNADETDQRYSADSSLIKTGVRSWNSSPAKEITSTNIDTWNNKSDFDGNYSSLTNAPDIANSTANKNITLSSEQSFSIQDMSKTIMRVNQSTGLIGMGSNVTSPSAQLEIGGTDGLLVRGTTNSGTARALGAGVRMHWYPRKGAFRAGMAESTYWDDDGTSYPKLALYSCAIGYQPRASGIASNAFGAYNQSTGDYSLTLGSYCQATSSHSIAIGTQAYATGIYSIAIGSGANTNGKDGAMVIGDDSYFETAYASKDNELTMRFSGGYRLWSSYPDSTSGVYMRHGQNGWSGYCDRNRKENFKKLDFEQVLKKIDLMPVTEWNYKGIDSLKYIGPMAQDFWNAFQLAGTDSLGINSICIDGVNMAAIKGLIERTDQLKAAVDELQVQKQKVAQLETILQQQSAIINDIKKKLDELNAKVSATKP